MNTLKSFLFLLLSAAAVPAVAQQGPQPLQQQATAPAPLARHLVMFTRAGPQFAKLREHMDQARAHQRLYERLAAEGHTVAGGAFEGQPVLGMTVFSEGIDEARARQLIAADELPKLGIVAYEFRMLGVRMGSFRK
jgi:hypothetical protein